MKGNVKVVGLLEGWPFQVQQDPTVINPKAGGVLQTLRKLFEK